MLGLPFAKINKSLNKLAGDYNDYLFVYSILWFRYRSITKSDYSYRLDKE